MYLLPSPVPAPRSCTAVHQNYTYEYDAFLPSATLDFGPPSVGLFSGATAWRHIVPKLVRWAATTCVPFRQVNLDEEVEVACFTRQADAAQARFFSPQNCEPAGGRWLLPFPATMRRPFILKPTFEMLR